MEIHEGLAANPDLHTTLARLRQLDDLVRGADNERKRILAQLRGDADEAEALGDAQRLDIVRWLIVDIESCVVD